MGWVGFSHSPDHIAEMLDVAVLSVDRLPWGASCFFKAVTYAPVPNSGISSADVLLKAEYANLGFFGICLGLAGSEGLIGCSGL